MKKRFVAVWFPHLKTDWFCRRDTTLSHVPFVLTVPDHGRMIISALNALAEKQGIYKGMTVADAKAIFPQLKVYHDDTEFSNKLLKAIAHYCIRFSPVVSVDAPDGVILDATGCAHLWKGELLYIHAVTNRFKNFGYDVKAAMADTIGAAWAVSRFGNNEIIIEPDQQFTALLSLPAAALRLDDETVEQLNKLGLRQVKDFIGIPKAALRRRFGKKKTQILNSEFRIPIITRINQALGMEEEVTQPVYTIEPYHERLPCPELISTPTGIEIALQRLLDTLCLRLQSEQKGLRSACFKCYRTDRNIQHLVIGTNSPSHNPKHLFKLFEIKIETIEPDLGIELFTLDASEVEELLPMQKKIWTGNELNDIRLTELIDRIANKIGSDHIHRYLPDEHYWPERSIKHTSSLNEQTTTTWRTNKPRPIQLLSKPELIQVTAPIPDYPPMLFRYQNKLHKIKKADGPERIEREWWIEEGVHRDYYSVEDEEGNRYWLFRLGDYDDKRPEWFIHGYF